MSSAAARPTAVTSSCDSGSPRPAARLVTRLTPATRTPRWRRAMVSQAVDMPTRSAPMVASMRISAGVS